MGDNPMPYCRTAVLPHCPTIEWPFCRIATLGILGKTLPAPHGESRTFLKRRSYLFNVSESAGASVLRPRTSNRTVSAKPPPLPIPPVMDAKQIRMTRRPSPRPFHCVAGKIRIEQTPYES